MQFIEEEKDGALKKIEDIFATVVERKEETWECKNSHWPKHTILCLLCFMGKMSK